MLNGLGLSTNYGYTNSQATLPPYVNLKDPNNPPPVGTISGPNRGLGGNIAPCCASRPTPSTSRRPMTSGTSQCAWAWPTTRPRSTPTPTTATRTRSPRAALAEAPRGRTAIPTSTLNLQLDLQGAYNLPKGFTAVAYGLNLNNEVFGFYQGSTIYPIQREFYKPTFGGGLRWSPTREK